MSLDDMLGSHVEKLIMIEMQYRCNSKKIKAVITLCIIRVALGQKTQNSLRWVH